MKTTDLLKLYKINAPWYAHRRLSSYISRRKELIRQYTSAKESGNIALLETIQAEGLEVKSYIDALSV